MVGVVNAHAGRKQANATRLYRDRDGAISVRGNDVLVIIGVAQSGDIADDVGQADRGRSIEGIVAGNSLVSVGAARAVERLQQADIRRAPAGSRAEIAVVVGRGGVGGVVCEAA